MKDRLLGSWNLNHNTAMYHNSTIEAEDVEERPFQVEHNISFLCLLDGALDYFLFKQPNAVLIFARLFITNSTSALAVWVAAAIVHVSRMNRAPMALHVSSLPETPANVMYCRRDA